MLEIPNLKLPPILKQVRGTRWINHTKYDQGTRYKEVRSGKQHNAPTHLPLYCILSLVELSLAQFHYMREMQGSNWPEMQTRTLDQQSNIIMYVLEHIRREYNFSLAFGKSYQMFKVSPICWSLLLLEGTLWLVQI